MQCVFLTDTCNQGNAFVSFDTYDKAILTSNKE